MKNIRHMLFSLVVILTLLFSNLGPISVFADDTVPPTEQTEEAVVEEPAVEAPVKQETVESPSSETTEAPDLVEGEEGIVPPADDGAIEETPAATEEPAAEQTQEATVEATVEAPEEPTAQPTPELSAEDLDTVPEILAQSPEGTELMILNSEGEPESLASEEAADILVEGDPMWCPGTTPPGSPGCTTSFTSFSGLISELSDNPTTYYGAGTIWVAYDYVVTADDDQIVFNGDSTADPVNNPHPLDNLTNLTIQGGVNGTNPDPALNISTIDVSMVFANWIGNITLNNIFINNTTNPVGFGLSIDTTGAVTMNNVNVSGTTGSSAAGDGDGAKIVSTGNVNITDSNFDTNDGNGLVVDSGGDIELTNVSASNNTLTGAYLNTCLRTGGVCLGMGNVTINGTTNLFNGNILYDGLVIDAGGSTALSGVTAEGNGLIGVSIESGDFGNGDTVQITNSSFLSNLNAPGLQIYQYADGDVTLNTVIASSNDVGTTIRNQGSGAVTIEDSNFSSNDLTGLDVSANGNISLTNVIAGSYTIGSTTPGEMGNGSNGAYLVTTGDITVTNSTFNENVQFTSPQDPGIYARAGGNILLDGVEASNNALGAGAVLLTTGTGAITVNNGSIFNNNGTFGIQANITDGDLTLNGVTAESNDVKGAYLIGSGTSSIFIQNGSQFVENGQYGVYASVDEGNININTGVLVDGNGVTQTGVKLVNNGSGTIDVTGSTFQNMLGAGLSVIANGIVNLDTNIIDNNVGNGAEVYSTYTIKECYCPGAVNTSVIVNVTGGTFSNSGQYGLYVKPGDEGSVDISTTTPPTFTDNVVGEYLIDTNPIPECSDCGCNVVEVPEGNPYNVIEVPFSGSGNVPQQCSIYAGTILQMENGTFVKVNCPFNGFSSLQGLNESDLPGLLGAGSDFDLGILLGLLGEDGSFVLNSDGTITLTFVIPENSRGRSHRLLFWDTTLNDNAGGWYQMPPFEFGTSFPLHPDDPEDPRLIVSGVAQYGNTMTVTVNFAGYFVVVGN